MTKRGGLIAGESSPSSEPGSRGTDGVDGELRQGRGELHGHAVERSFRNAIGRRPSIGAIGQLFAGSGDIDEERRFAFREQRLECARNAQKSRRTRARE